MRPFKLPKTARAWNWIELDQTEAEELWRLLRDFVAFVNCRYVERPEQLIPPCWAEHGALVEELTTLCWSRWHAFEGEDGSVGGAQFWHSYTLPMFLGRMAHWLGADRLRKCQMGKHQETPVEEPAGAEGWEARTRAIGRADVGLRRAVRPRSEAGGSSVGRGSGVGWVEEPAAPPVQVPASDEAGDTTLILEARVEDEQ